MKLGQDGCFLARCFSSSLDELSTVCRNSLAGGTHRGWRRSCVSGAGEEASREEASPQTQPEAQVRVPGDTRQRNLRQSEESQGKIRETGE